MVESQTTQSQGSETSPDTAAIVEALRSAITGLTVVAEQLVEAFTALRDATGGDNGLSTQHLAQEIKRLRDQQERILSGVAKLDNEVIRAHGRIDNAGDVIKEMRKSIKELDRGKET